MPILEAIAVTVLVYYTAAKFLVPRNNANAAPRRLWIAPPPFYREVPTSSSLSGSEAGSAGGLCTFAVLAGAMAAVCGVLAAPTAYLGTMHI